MRSAYSQQKRTRSMGGTGGVSRGSALQGLSPAGSITSSQRVGEGVNYNTKRPFESMGKTSINVFGAPVNYQEPMMPDAPTPFKGVPVLEQLAGAFGTATQMVGNTQPLALPHTILSTLAWEMNKGNDGQRELQAAVDKNLISEGKAKAMMLRQVMDKEAILPKFMRDAVAPGEDGFGGTMLQLMGIIDMPFEFLNRAIIAKDPNDRTNSLAAATDEQLENNVELIRIRDEFKAGTIGQDEAIDDLIIAGFGQSNPRRSDIPLVAGLQNLVGTMFTDPVNLVSVGLAGLGRAAAKASIRGAEQMVGRLGESAVADLANSAAAKGLKPSFAATLDEALANPATKAAAEDIVKSMSKQDRFVILEAPIVMRVGRKIEHVLDPLTLFGSDRAGALTTQQLAAQAGSGLVKGMGLNSIRQSRNLIESRYGADVAALFDEGLDTAGMNIALQVGNHQSVIHAIRSQGLNGLDTDATALARKRVMALGEDVAGRVQDLTERVRHRIIPLESGSAGMTRAMARARERAVQQVIRISGNADEALARSVVADMDKDMLELLDMQHYGVVVKDFVAARQVVDAGTEKVMARVTFVGPRQLTQHGVDELVRMVKKKNTPMASIRSYIERFDELYRVYDPDLPDDELKGLLARTLPSLREQVPSVITDMSKLSQGMRDFATRYGTQGYSVGLRPADDLLARPIMDKGKLVAANPWIDVVDEKTARQTISRAGVLKQQLFGNVSGAAVARDARNRFADLAAKHGIASSTADAMFDAVQRAAQERSTTSRGLSPGEMYSAATSMKLKRSMRARMTERQFASMVLEAHEGSLSVVGWAQKFTGKAKVTGHKMTGANPFGILAERLYPNTKFKYNPFFQLQELIETPFFLILRGMVPMEDFKRVWTSDGRHAIAEETERTLKMMEDLQSRGLYIADMMDQSGVYTAGYRATRDALHDASIAGKIGRKVPNIHGIKDYGVARAYEYRQAKLVAKAMGEDVSPQSWANWMQWMGMRYKTPRSEHAMAAFYFDALARQDPRSVFSKFGPEAFRPAHLSRTARVSPDLVKFSVLGDDGADMSWSDFRARLRDPEDELTVQDTIDSLERMGAEPGYIERAVFAMTGPAPDEFFDGMVKLGVSKPEVVALREFMQNVADMRGMSLEELMTTKFADVPRNIDHLGNHTGKTMFHRLMDAMSARDIELPEPTDPAFLRSIESAIKRLPKWELDPTPIPLPDVPGAWKTSAYADLTELVPTRFFRDGMQGQRTDPEHVRKLAQELEERGFDEPIMLEYSQADNGVALTEANHRIAAAISLGMDYVPVRIKRRVGPFNDSEMMGFREVNGLEPDEFGYVKGDLRPSDVGLHTNIGIAEVARNSTWGSSHAASMDTTGAAARIMGIDGYRIGGGVEDALDADATRYLNSIRQSPGSLTPIYSGRRAGEDGTIGIPKVGSRIDVPLKATTPDASYAHGYSYSRNAGYGTDDAKGFIYEFAEGTKGVRYSDDEFLTSGRFEVTAVDEVPYWQFRGLPEGSAPLADPVKVVRVKQIQVYNPQRKAWEATSVPSKVKHMTKEQVDRRAYEAARARREADATLGMPKPVTGRRGLTAEQGKAVQALYDAGDPEAGAALQRELMDAPGAVPGFGVPPLDLNTIRRNGKVIGKLGHTEPDEWLAHVDNAFDEDEIAEMLGWYEEVRRSLFALAGGDEEKAARLMLGFGIGQKGTSPVAGMRQLFEAVALVRREGKLPDSFGGLSRETLQNIIGEDRVVAEGMGQKLTDFIDTILGVKERSAGVLGPRGNWGPVAFDVHMKRDAGFLDDQMADHLKHAYGAKRVTYSRETGFNIEMPDGSAHNIAPEHIGRGVPGDDEYDYGVEAYNARRDAANAANFMGRNDWTSGQIQTIGWFKVKRMYGDETGSPLDSIFGNKRDVYYETIPAPGSPFEHLYPAIEDDEVIKRINTEVASYMDMEIEELFGVTLLGRSRGGYGAWTKGEAAGRVVPNVQMSIVGERRDAVAAGRALAFLNQQEGVPVVRAAPASTKARITGKDTNFMWVVDWKMPGATKEQAEAALRSLADGDGIVRTNGGSVMQADDGSWYVGAMWVDDDVWQYEAGKAIPRKAFEKAHPVDNVDVEGGTFVPERSVVESTYAENDWTGAGAGQDHLGWLRENGYGEQARALETVVQPRASIAYERAYRKHYAHGTDAHRRERALVDPGYAERAEPVDAAYAESIARNPEPGINVDDARDAARAGRPFFHKVGRSTLGATLIDAADRRTRIFLNKGKFDVDTVLHEFVHDFADELDPSGRSMVLDAFNEAMGRKKVRDIPATPAAIADVEARNKAAREAYDAEVKAYDAEVATRTAPPPEPEPLPVARETNPATPIAAKWRATEKRDSVTMEKNLVALEQQDIEVRDAMDRLDDYRNVERGDFDDAEEYRDAKTEAWDDLLDALDEVASQVDDDMADAAALAAERANVVPEPTWTGLPIQPGQTKTVKQVMRGGDWDEAAFRQQYGAHIQGDRITRPDPMAGLVKPVEPVYEALPGAMPGARRTPLTEWDDEVEEWFANQMVEYVRTGEPVRVEMKPLFDFYGKYIDATTQRRRGRLQPELKASLDTILSRKTERAFGYNGDEAALLDVMLSQADRASRNANDLIHFRTNRSWLERSLNHPFFGMYPLSYMYGKVLPELVEFLVFRPFGVPAPLLALNTLQNIYQSVMQQAAYDPELRAYLADNEPALRAIAFLVPGVPWDLPVNAPLWLRRTAEAVATQNQRALEGKKNADGTPAGIDLTKVDLQKTIFETADYSLNPLRGVGTAIDTAAGIGAIGAMGVNYATGGGNPLNSTPDPRTQQGPNITPEQTQGSTNPLEVELSGSAAQLQSQLSAP